MTRVFLPLFFLLLTFGQFQALRISPEVRIYLHELILVLLLIVNAKNFKKQFLLKPIVIFFGIGILSLLIQVSEFGWEKIGISSLYLWRWLAYAGLYSLTARLKFPFLPWLYVSGTAMAVLGLLQLWLYPDLRNLYYLGWDPHYERLFSTLLDPNFTGLIIVLTLILGLWKKYPWFTQVLLLVSFYFTYSRSSFLALALGLGSYFVFTRKIKLIAIFLVLLSLIFWLWASQPSVTQNILREETAVARLTNWQESWELFRKSPIVGYGFNTIRYLPKFQPKITEIPSLAQAGVDNSFLFILLTTGAVGLCAYLWLLVNIWKLNSVVVNSLLIAIIVHSLFNNSLFYPWVLVWLWILVGKATSDK